MKVNLNIVERLVLLQIVPQETNFVTLKAVNTLIDQIGVKDKEAKEFDIKHDGTKVKWNVEKVMAAKEKEFDIGEIMTEKIKAALKEMNDQEKLTAQHYTLYEKFVENAK
jgi:hypothetical protein